jgi:hypothetical protein
MKADQAHLHGVFISGRGFLSPHRVYDEDIEDKVEDIFVNEAHALTAFKLMLLKCLATFPRSPIDWSPAADRYHYDFVEASGSRSKKAPGAIATRGS